MLNYMQPAKRLLALLLACLLALGLAPSVFAQGEEELIAEATIAQAEEPFAVLVAALEDDEPAPPTRLWGKFTAPVIGLIEKLFGEVSPEWRPLIELLIILGEAWLVSRSIGIPVMIAIIAPFALMLFFTPAIFAPLVLPVAIPVWMLLVLSGYAVIQVIASIFFLVINSF